MSNTTSIEQQDAQDFVADLFLTYRGLMFSTAQRFTTDIYAQEDIIQDVLLHLFQKADLLQSLAPSALICYIITSVKHTAINHLTKRNREQPYLSSLEDAEKYIPDLDDPVEELILSKENISQFYKYFNELPEKDRTLLFDKYILDLNDDEIAASFNCKSSSIRMKLTRARRQLLRLFQKGGYPYE